MSKVAKGLFLAVELVAVYIAGEAIERGAKAAWRTIKH